VAKTVDVSAPTEVFSADSDGRAIAFYTARRRPTGPNAASPRGLAWDVIRTLEEFAQRGWDLSVAQMFGDATAPTVYISGALHDADIVGAFEAPSLAEAARGITALEAAGWTELFSTNWLLGPREFQPVPSTLGRDPSHEWCFFALWEWNDAWQQATAAQRREYDLECDEAFSFDLNSGVSIAGRHRLDWASSWHHLGIWEIASPEVADRAMQMHERVADFKFTTSRHYLGRRQPFIDYLEELS
jgi:hypothetical protein